MTVASKTECPFAIPAKQDEVHTLDLQHQLAEMRKSGSLCPAKMPYGSLNNGMAWVATGYEEVKGILKNNGFSLAYQATGDFPRARVAEVGAPFPHSFIDMDPPEHTEHRRTMMKHLNPQRVNKLREYTAALVDTCIDDVIKAGPGADLKEQIAFRVPLGLLCELLGSPLGDQHIYTKDAHDFVAQRHSTPEEAGASLDVIKNYFSKLVAAKQQEPGEDLISALLQDVEVKGTWTRDELDNVGTIMLIAGYDSTASFLSSMLHWLIYNPETFAMLRNDETLLQPAMEEFLRMFPVGVPGARTRVATEDIQFGDVLVRKDESVLAISHAANMDPKFFEDPFEFKLDRPKNIPQIAFGFGIHFCPGSLLARMDIEMVLRGLLKRFEKLEPFQYDENWLANSRTRGPVDIRVKW